MTIQKDIENIEKSAGKVEEPKLEVIEEEMSAKVEEVTEKPEEVEPVEEEAMDPSLKSIEDAMDAKIKEVVKEEPKVEIKEIDEVEEAPLEEIENEISILRRNYSILNVKKEVSQSTLEMVKKNFEEGAIDEAAYNRLRTKYENELTGLLTEIEDINKKITSRETIIPKYKDLFKLRSKYNTKIKALEKEIGKNNNELEFFKSRKLSIISSAADYLSNILQGMRKEEENLKSSGIEIPVATAPKNYQKMIKKNKETLAELKATQGVLPTILENLEKKRTANEMDNDTYLKMKSEYNTVKTKTDGEIKRVEEIIRRIENELDIYNKIDKSTESCKFIANALSDSFRKIWLEDQIEELDAETQDLINQEQKLETELDTKAKKMSKELDKLHEKIA